MHAHTRTQIHVCMHSYIHTNLSTYTHGYKSLHTHTRSLARSLAPFQTRHIHAHTHTHTHAHTHTHTHARTHTHTHTHTSTHTQTPTHIPSIISNLVIVSDSLYRSDPDPVDSRFRISISMCLIFSLTCVCACVRMWVNRCAYICTSHTLSPSTPVYKIEYRKYMHAHTPFLTHIPQPTYENTCRTQATLTHKHTTNRDVVLEPWTRKHRKAFRQAAILANDRRGTYTSHSTSQIHEHMTPRQGLPAGSKSCR